MHINSAGERSQYVSTHSEEEGKYIRIAVKDEGEGLREEEIGHPSPASIKGSTTYKGQVSIIRLLLVEMHGGSISAKNNEGKGACFFFTLPYRRERLIKSVQVFTNVVAPPGG